MGKAVIGAEGRTLICIPLVAKTDDELLLELAGVKESKPDVIEWRADYYEKVDEFDRVVALANLLYKQAEGITMLFTFRSVCEGGCLNSLTDEEILALNTAVCQNTQFEYVDCELRHDPAAVALLKQAAERNQTKIIGSFHDFSGTPEQAVLAAKFAQAARLEMAVAKVAVMPQKAEDLVSLLSATLAARKTIPIPLISIAMGGMGVVSRIFGQLFGSCLTFAAGCGESAPGQLAIEELRTVMGIVQK